MAHESALPVCCVALSALLLTCSSEQPAMELGGNPRVGQEIRVDARGLHVRPRFGAPELSLRLGGFGCTSAVQRPTAASVKERSDGTIEIARGLVTEWYRNTRTGVEQGFDVPTRPACGSDLVFLLETNAAAKVLSGTASSLQERQSGTTYRMAGLYVRDSEGKAIPSRFALREGALAIEVDAKSARFPLVVDPWIVTEEAKLTPVVGRGDPNEKLGKVVAMDATTMIVGAPGMPAIGSQVETAYVYVRGASGWVPQAELLENEYLPDPSYGSAVALSSGTSLVAAPTAYTGVAQTGSVHVFVQSGTNWSRQTKLVPADATTQVAFGRALAIDGNTAVVAAPDADSPIGTGGGKVYVFVRSGTTWGEQAQLTPKSGTASDQFGAAVAVVGDTVLVGAPGYDSTLGTDAGIVYVFTRSGTVWSQVGTMEPDGDDGFGSLVALDGTTALVAAPFAQNASGLQWSAAYVFVGGGSSWVKQARLESGESSAVFWNVAAEAIALSGDTAVMSSRSPDSVVGGRAHVYVRSGSTWSKQVTLDAPDTKPADGFGASAAAGGDTVAIGAPYADPNALQDAGAVHMFERSGSSWTRTAILDAGDSCTGRSVGFALALDGDTAVLANAGSSAGGVGVFSRSGTSWAKVFDSSSPSTTWPGISGYSVALQSGTLVVGAPAYNVGAVSGAGSGFVYVGSGTTWAQQAQLVASDGGVTDGLGTAACIDGDTVVLGARSADVGGKSNAGAAYVFVRNGATWSEQAKLTASDGAANDEFGSSVSISGDTVLVGAPSHTTTKAVVAGAAYVFVRGGNLWTEQAQLFSSNGTVGSKFGASLAIRGETALVGAWSQNTAAGYQAGSAYAFVRSGTSWGPPTELQPSDAAGGKEFGYSVALGNDIALVSALYGNPVGPYRGNAYVFSFDGLTWAEQAEFSPTDGATDDGFGANVALSGDTALIGAWGAKIPSSFGPSSDSVGAAYVFRIGSCSAGGECASGHCVDGVCCDTDCGGGLASDCQACSVARGAAVDGTCGPVVAGRAYVCRGPAGPCDLAETCDGSSPACPPDSFQPSSVECRAASCSVTTEVSSSHCTGSTPECPPGASGPCGDYRCGASSCLGTCSKDTDCAPGRTCGSGSCASPVDGGGSGGAGSGTGGTSSVDGGATTGGSTSADDGSVDGASSSAGGQTGPSDGSLSGGGAGGVPSDSGSVGAGGNSDPDAGTPSGRSKDSAGCGCKLALDSTSPDTSALVMLLLFLGSVRRRTRKAITRTAQSSPASPARASDPGAR